MQPRQWRVIVAVSEGFQILADLFRVILEKLLQVLSVLALVLTESLRSPEAVFGFRCSVGLEQALVGWLERPEHWKRGRERPAVQLKLPELIRPWASDLEKNLAKKR